ncbi:hypothetical protein [Nonomuraea dietziae]|uniref:hypothetical protein n=1 Tax=Nonomuraea dietziae TaxID=65515 RepID=UPI0031E3B9F7
MGISSEALEPIVTVPRAAEPLAPCVFWVLGLPQPARIAGTPKAAAPSSMLLRVIGRRGVMVGSS